MTNLSTNGDADFIVKIVSDETVTAAEVIHHHPKYRGGYETIGFGKSLRRKGETRNPALGDALALSRAFQDAANTYNDEVFKLTEPPVTVAGVDLSKFFAAPSASAGTSLFANIQTTFARVLGAGR